MPLAARLPEGLDVAQCTCLHFVLSGIFLARPDQGSPPESCGGPIPPAICSIPQGDHDSFFNLPAGCREARRPINKSMDLRPPRSAPGYLACEPVTFAGSPRAAPSRDAPPGFEPRPLWPPSFRAATSSVDTCAAARDQLARRAAPLPPAASAASHYLAYL